MIRNWDVHNSNRTHDHNHMVLLYNNLMKVVFLNTYKEYTNYYMTKQIFLKGIVKT